MINVSSLQSGGGLYKKGGGEGERGKLITLGELVNLHLAKD